MGGTLPRTPNPLLRAVLLAFFSYKANDSGKKSDTKMFEKHRSAKDLTLVLGAQVMLISNTSVVKGMVNGTRGVVTGFVQPRELHDRLSLGHGSATKLPKVRFSLPNGDNIEKLILPVKWPIEKAGEVVASRTQLPLKLAWAITIHKSQGMSISRLEVSLGDIFDAGMGYVALSRGVALDGIKVISYKPQKIRVHDKVETFGKQLAQHIAQHSAGASAPAAAPVRRVLTAEQQQRIRQNKAEALKKRALKTKQPQSNQPVAEKGACRHGARVLSQESPARAGVRAPGRS